MVFLICITIFPWKVMLILFQGIWDGERYVLCKRRGSESFLIPSSLLSDPLLLHNKSLSISIQVFSIQVHLYPQLKRGICEFWKSSIATAWIWTRDLSHLILALNLLSYQGLMKCEGLFRDYIYAALRITFCWKIAGLWPAIFSGTPGNFESK